ncbi:MAG: enoyl-CoA hydratase/isomerase family protein [Paracoccaceae bacterium]
MDDLLIRVEGRVGRLTLNRPEALNALSYPMCLALAAALRAWRTDPLVALVLIDAVGDRAFCAGGDIAQLYAEARAGDFSHGQQFWRDEYRMNASIAAYPKPVVSLMQGFTMGGGVGVGCHASHRIVGETSQIAMPECGIGLVPDVGGSYLLAKAPGYLGAYLGVTGARMGPADAIYAGFADKFVPQAAWPELVAALVKTGSVAAIEPFARVPVPGRLEGLQRQIDASFGLQDIGSIAEYLDTLDTEFARETQAALRRVSPLAAAAAVEMQTLLRPAPDLHRALELEYRYTFRAQEQSDFIEGIRAAIIDKDRKPRWRYEMGTVPMAAVRAMLAPLGENAMTFEE